jgi:glycine/D-amino acid oxidase-like deaminating enzyme
MVVVVGGGLMGSAAGWAVARAGQKVLLLEKQDPDYYQGSSFGQARITRSLGPKDDIFTFLQNYSTELTRELIEFLNENDDQKHSVEEVFTTSPVTYVFRANQKDDVLALTTDQNDPHDVSWTKDEAEQKFGMITEDDHVIIREKKELSGTLNPQILIRKLHRAIELCGGEVRYDETVNQIEIDSDGYTINCSEKVRSARLIIACGPYTKSIIGDHYPALNKLFIQRSDLSFFTIKDEVFEALSSSQKAKFRTHFPVAEFDHEIYYSMIEYFDGDKPIIKVGGHFKREDADYPDEVWGTPVSSEQHEWALNKTLMYLRMLGIDLKEKDLELINEYSCIYTLTKSEVPLVVNRINIENQIDPNCVVITGLSGVGAKGSLAYGRLAADRLLGLSNADPLYQKTKKELGNERLLPDTEL